MIPKAKRSVTIVYIKQSNGLQLSYIRLSLFMYILAGEGRLKIPKIMDPQAVFLTAWITKMEYT